MSPPQLAVLKQPIAIRTEHVATERTTLRVRQSHTSIFGGDFTISRDDSTYHAGPSDHFQPIELLSVKGKVLTWSQKRAFLDSSGLPLFDLYCKPLSAVWYVELPGERTNTPMVQLVPQRSTFKDKFDVYVRNAADDGRQVVLEARGQDIWKLRTNFYLGDACVMTAKRTDKMAVYVPGRKIEWVVDIARRLDASLVSCRVLSVRVSIAGCVCSDILC